LAVLYLQTNPETGFAMVYQIKIIAIQTEGAFADIKSTELLFKYLVGEIEVKEVEEEEGEEDEGKDNKKKKKKKGKKKGGGGGGSEITLMPTLFPEAYYNGQPKTFRHEEDVLEMNSLLGGTHTHTQHTHTHTHTHTHVCVCVCVCVCARTYIHIY